MPEMWTLGGLSVRELLRRTWIESWTDAVYGQAGRMAFYHFLAIFPCLVIGLALAGGVPSIGPGMKSTAGGVVQEILPPEAAGLIHQMVSELQQQSLAGFSLLFICGGALWAAMNGTWALVFGLDVAYEVQETRNWWELGITIAGLTITLAVLGGLALLLLFFAVQIEARIFHYAPLVLLQALDWIAVIVLLMLSFAIVYRFAPNLRDAEWKWSTPGSLCALGLWVISTLALRFYFAHVSNYHRTYGHLNTVVMLMLWLYFTNAAILIGGEMNSEIEKAAAEQRGEKHRDSGTKVRGSIKEPP